MFFLPPNANMFSVWNYFRRGPASSNISHDITLLGSGALPMAARTLKSTFAPTYRNKLSRKIKHLNAITTYYEE
jgi:hypothetical protein